MIYLICPLDDLDHDLSVRDVKGLPPTRAHTDDDSYNLSTRESSYRGLLYPVITRGAFFC